MTKGSSGLGPSLAWRQQDACWTSVYFLFFLVKLHLWKRAGQRDWLSERGRALYITDARTCARGFHEQRVAVLLTQRRVRAGSSRVGQQQTASFKEASSPAPSSASSASSASSIPHSFSSLLFFLPLLATACYYCSESAIIVQPSARFDPHLQPKPQTAMCPRVRPRPRPAVCPRCLLRRLSLPRSCQSGSGSSFSSCFFAASVLISLFVKVMQRSDKERPFVNKTFRAPAPI